MTRLQKMAIYEKMDKIDLIELLIDAEEKSTIQYVPIWQYIPSAPYLPLYPTVTYRTGMNSKG